MAHGLDDQISINGLKDGLSMPRDPTTKNGANQACKRDWHGSKADKKQGCPKGPPHYAVHMSSKLVGPEPVQNTQGL